MAKSSGSGERGTRTSAGTPTTGRHASTSPVSTDQPEHYEPRHSTAVHVGKHRAGE